MRKKLICLNLALLLLLSLLSTGALAGDSGSAYSTDEAVSTLQNLETRYVTFYKNDESGESTYREIHQGVSNGQIWWPSLSNYWYDYESAYQLGWNTKADGSGTDVYSPDNLSSDENNPSRLYAEYVTVTTPAVMFRLKTVSGDDYYVLERDDLSGDEEPVFTLPQPSQFETDKTITGWSVSRGFRFGTYLPGEAFSPDGSDLWTAYPLYSDYVTVHYKETVYSWESNDAWRSEYYFEESRFPSIPSHVYNYPDPDEILVGFNSQQDGTGAWIMETDAFSTLPKDVYAIYEEIPENENYVIVESEKGIIIDGKKLTSHVMTYDEGGAVTLPVSLADGTPVTLWSDGSAQYPSGVPVTVASSGTIYPYVTSADGGNTGIIYGNGGKTESGSEYQYIWSGVTTSGSLAVPQFAYFYKDGYAMTGYKSEDGIVYSLNLSAENLIAACEENGAPAKFDVQYTEVNAPFIQYIGRGGVTSSGAAYVIDAEPDGTTFTVKDNMFTAPDGAVFLGWMDSDDDYGATFYDAGDTIDLNGKDHIALQACWSTPYQSHRVTYHYTDRDGTTQEATLLSSRVSPPNNASSKPSSWGIWGEDYLIAGWNTKEDGTGTWYRDGQSLDENDPRVIDLYEQVVDLDELTDPYCIVIYNSLGKPRYEVLEIVNGQVTLPETEYGWWNASAVTTIATSGYLDELIPKLSTGIVSATSGDRFSEVNLLTSTMHKNYDSNDETREFYIKAVVTASNLQLPTAQEVFGSDGIQRRFTGWNTKADGSGNTVASVYGSIPADLYAQWEHIIVPTLPVSGTVTRPNDGPSTDASDGWNDIQNEVSDTVAGDGIDIDMNGETEVPSEIFGEIAGKDVTISFNMGNGISWTINGQDIPLDVTIEETDLGISLNTHGVPVDVVGTVAGDLESVQFTLSHDGQFGFDMTLTIPLGNTNSGFWANLYYYVDGGLKFQTSSRIASDGSAALRMTHASQYVIVIDDHSHATPFTDVSSGDWFYDAVSYVYANGLMDGVSDTLFDPNGEVTRAQLVTILWRLDGEPVVNYAMPFDDVASGEWYTEAVRWAASEGIVEGVSDTEFAPGEAVTREQFAAILYRYAQYDGMDAVTLEENLGGFTDADSISEYAGPALNWAVGEGIIIGVTATTIEPQGTATRAQAAAMLMRFVENVK